MIECLDDILGWVPGILSLGLSAFELPPLVEQVVRSEAPHFQWCPFFSSDRAWRAASK